MRYISTTEACWRLFQFELNYRDPPVERLNFHLENEQQVIFPDSTDVRKILRRKGVKETKFTQWMETNKQHEEAKELTYADFPTKWVWKASEKKWEKKKTRICNWKDLLRSPNKRRKILSKDATEHRQRMHIVHENKNSRWNGTPNILSSMQGNGFPR